MTAVGEFQHRIAISVCICTYNRAESLRRTLSSLAAQREVLWNEYEILVIDNNCTDHTPEVVDSFKELLPIRRFEEKVQGLGHARNRAVADSGGAVIVFTDDDIVFESGWLAAYRVAVHMLKEADYFGGRMLPDWRNGKPGWYLGEPLELIDGLLGRYDLGQAARVMTSLDPTPFGANFAIRRTLANALGAFRADLGVSGKQGGRGEETEFFLRARKVGAKGAYVGNALCWHSVESHRFTLRSLYHYGVECGKAHRVIDSKVLNGSHVRAAIYVLKGIWQIFKGRGDRFRQCIVNAGIQRGLRQNVPPTLGPENRGAST